MFWLKLVRWMWAWGTVSGALFGSGFGTLLLPVFGTIIGLFFGIIVAAVAGIVTGLALAILTRLRYFPPQDSYAYRFNAIGVVLLCILLIDLPFLSRFWGNGLILVIPPTIIAGISASICAWRFPDYAQTQFALRNPPANVLS